MAAHRLLVLLAAACYVGAGVASPRAGGSKDETSNIIPVMCCACFKEVPGAAVTVGRGGQALATGRSPPQDAASSSSAAPGGGAPTTTTARPPSRPAAPARSGFSRFISDIFQIPISVLRAVNNLLANPFNREAPAAAKGTAQ